jgi:hypothetical protein
MKVSERRLSPGRHTSFLFCLFSPFSLLAKPLLQLLHGRPASDGASSRAPHVCSPRRRQGESERRRGQDGGIALWQRRRRRKRPIDFEVLRPPRVGPRRAPGRGPASGWGWAGGQLHCRKACAQGRQTVMCTRDRERERGFIAARRLSTPSRSTFSKNSTSTSTSTSTTQKTAQRRRRAHRGQPSTGGHLF